MSSLGKKESLKVRDHNILEVDPEMIGDETDPGKIDPEAGTKDLVTDPEATPEIMEDRDPVKGQTAEVVAGRDQLPSRREEET